MGLLRHGAVETVFGGRRVPSNPRLVPTRLHPGQRPPARRRPPGTHRGTGPAAPLLPGAETLAFIDIDSPQKPVYSYMSPLTTRCLSGVRWRYADS